MTDLQALLGACQLRSAPALPQLQWRPAGHFEATRQIPHYSPRLAGTHPTKDAYRGYSQLSHDGRCWVLPAPASLSRRIKSFAVLTVTSTFVFPFAITRDNFGINYQRQRTS